MLMLYFVSPYHTHPSNNQPTRGNIFLQGNPLSRFYIYLISQGDADTDFVLCGMKEDGVQVSPACPRWWSNLFFWQIWYFQLQTRRSYLPKSCLSDIVMFISRYQAKCPNTVWPLIFFNSRHEGHICPNSVVLASRSSGSRTIVHTNLGDFFLSWISLTEIDFAIQE